MWSFTYGSERTRGKDEEADKKKAVELLLNMFQDRCTARKVQRASVVSNQVH